MPHFCFTLRDALYLFATTNPIYKTPRVAEIIEAESICFFLYGFSPIIDLVFAPFNIIGCIFFLHHAMYHYNH